MSLLYECINGVIQGGILEGNDEAPDGEDVASLCVNKLRGMLVVEGDPNRLLPPHGFGGRTDVTLVRYVALLAFNKIASSHRDLVLMQEDVILSCIDDPDISIRLKALDLSLGMVNSENLVAVVERLMQQLRSTLAFDGTPHNGHGRTFGVEPAADSEDEDPEEVLRQGHEIRIKQQALPAEYRTIVIRHVLDMCSKDTYTNISDFEWYIDILLQLVNMAPSDTTIFDNLPVDQDGIIPGQQGKNIVNAIGCELRNVAVRVGTVREKTLKAANTLIAAFRIGKSSNASVTSDEGVLGFAAWISGEYVRDCENVHNTLDALLHPGIESLPPYIVCAYVQAIPKALTQIVSVPPSAWVVEQKTKTALLIERIIKFLEPFSNHPDLDAQERAVELLELMKVVSQAITAQVDYEPLLLTEALPRLFSNVELNPVAPKAQRKVPMPAKLQLDTPINNDLPNLLGRADQDCAMSDEMAAFELFYNQRPLPKTVGTPAVAIIPSYNITSSSYQLTEESANDASTTMQKRLERQERNKDDPFYIAGREGSSGTSTPFHDVLRRSDGDDVDIDSIPIMDLDLGHQQSLRERFDAAIPKLKKRRPRKVHIVQDETIDHEDSSQQLDQASDSAFAVVASKKKSLLEVDSSGLGSLSLGATDDKSTHPKSSEKEAEDLEMAKALAEVERLRLEMQRASERVQAADGAPAEGTLVKQKKKKKMRRETRKEQGTIEVGNPASPGSRLDAASAEKDGAVWKEKKRKNKNKPLKVADNVAAITYT